MKKISLTVLSICIFFLAIAQPKKTLVKVQMGLRQIIQKLAAEKSEGGDFMDYIGLYKVQSGSLKEIDSLKLPATATSFSFSFSPEYKGYYTIGISRYFANEDPKSINRSRMNQQVFRFYAKGGESVNMQIDSIGTYHMKDGNTKENQLLGDWGAMLYPVQTIIYTGNNFPEVYPVFTSLDSSAGIWLKGKTSGNAAFDELFKKTVAYDIAYFTCRYVISPRRQDALWEKNIADFTGYVAATNFSAMMQDTFLLQLPNGNTAMGAMVNTIARMNYLRGDSAKNIDYLAKELSFIPNKRLKACYAADYTRYVNNYDKVQAILDEHGKYMTAAQKKMLTDRLAQLAEFKKGAQGFDFSYTDVNGKKVSFSDLKGKVVLVDVWATWCGPCRAELPHLKELEELYQGNDKIAFVGLSVDENTSEAAWKKFVAANDLKGIQIRAENGMNSKISQIYRINSIPRFMVFDKQGKVVSIDSPRPSDPKLKTMLDETLKN